MKHFVEVGVASFVAGVVVGRMFLAKALVKVQAEREAAEQKFHQLLEKIKGKL